MKHNTMMTINAQPDDLPTTQSGPMLYNTFQQRASDLTPIVSQANVRLPELEKPLVSGQIMLPTIIDNLPDFIDFKNTTSQTFLDNVAHARVFGLAAKDLIGKTDMDLFSVELIAKFYADERAMVHFINHDLSSSAEVIKRLEHTDPKASRCILREKRWYHRFFIRP